MRRIREKFSGLCPLRMREASLAIGHIQDPVELVFNAPVRPNGTTHLRRIAGQRTQIKLHLTGGLVPKMPHPDDHHHSLHSHPLRLLIEVSHSGYGEHPDLSIFPAIVTRLDPLVVTVLNPLKALRLGCLKPCFHLGASGGMVGFETQDVICPLGHNLPSNALFGCPWHQS